MYQRVTIVCPLVEALPAKGDRGEPGNEATPLVALRADSSIIQIGAKQKEHDSNWENEKWV